MLRRRFRPRPRPDDSEEDEPESLSEPDVESEFESESEFELESEEELDLALPRTISASVVLSVTKCTHLFLLPSTALSFSSLSFSFAAKILLAVPFLLIAGQLPQHKHEKSAAYGFLNSSGTSTEGFPSALSFASTRGFSSCCVLEGRDTYGRVFLH